MRFLSLLAVPAVAVALAACGSSSSSTPSTSTTSTPPAAGSTQPSGTTTSPSTTPATVPSAGNTVQVKMQSLAFMPAAVTAKVGEAVVFTNFDSPAHNVTYVSGPPFTSSPTMSTGATFTIKLTQAGTIHYYCSLHPFMKGTIVVTK